MNKLLGLLLLAAVGGGCANVAATRTTQLLDGQTVTDKITVRAFLESIKQGQYSSGSGLTLSVSDATPDQQSIAKLSDGVISLATLFAARQPTNSIATGTNATPTGP
jgi:hypothetical protein